MALPSLDEFRRLYESVPGAGAAIEAGTQGAEQGMNLGSLVQARQQEAALRKQKFQEAVQALALKKQAVDASTRLENARAAALENAPTDQSIFTIDDKGNLKEAGKVPKGSKVMSQQDKMGSPIAVSRMSAAALSDILKSPDISRNKTIIERGQRIEGITDPSQIVQDQAVLGLIQEAVEAQTRGGVSSAMGLKKLTNETPEQFAARIIAKIKNAPQDASVGQFVNQLKAISRQETKAAIRGYQGTVLGNAEAAAKVYDDINPRLAHSIRAGAHAAIAQYLNSAFGSEGATEDMSGQDVSKFVDESAGVKTVTDPEFNNILSVLQGE